MGMGTERRMGAEPQHLDAKSGRQREAVMISCHSCTVGNILDSNAFVCISKNGYTCMKKGMGIQIHEQIALCAMEF